MTRYLVTYHGGGMPEGDDARRQAMAAFGAWVASVGDSLVDPGAPLGPARTVSPDGVGDDVPAGPPGGWSVLEAADLDTAVALVRDHPFVGRGGSLRVSEAVTP